MPTSDILYGLMTCDSTVLQTSETYELFLVTTVAAYLCCNWSHDSDYGVTSQITLNYATCITTLHLKL